MCCLVDGFAEQARGNQNNLRAMPQDGHDGEWLGPKESAHQTSASELQLTKLQIWCATTKPIFLNGLFSLIKQKSSEEK